MNGYDYINNEIKIQTIQQLESYERLCNSVDTSSDNESKQAIQKCKDKGEEIKCWVCMDKHEVYCKRGFGSWLDGSGSFDLKKCRCQSDNKNDCKWIKCIGQEYIDGAKICKQDFNVNENDRTEILYRLTHN